MPTVSVERDELFKLLGKNYTQEEFEGLCFDFGIELDEVTNEHLANRKREDGVENKIIYKIDVPANRYDLLCIEGLARSLNIFLGREKLPIYKLSKSSIKAIVKKNTSV